MAASTSTDNNAAATTTPSASSPAKVGEDPHQQQQQQQQTGPQRLQISNTPSPNSKNPSNTPQQQQQHHSKQRSMFVSQQPRPVSARSNKASEGQLTSRTTATTVTAAAAKDQKQPEQQQEPGTLRSTHSSFSRTLNRSTASCPGEVLTDSGRVIRLGNSGTGAFRSSSKRFNDKPPITSNIDSVPSELVSSLGKGGHKQSFSRASDRFKTAPPVTANSDSYYFAPSIVPVVAATTVAAAPTSDGGGSGGGSAENSATRSHRQAAATAGLLAGGGSRFADNVPITANTDYYNPPGIAKVHSFRKAGGAGLTSAPRFSEAASVPKSVRSVYEETAVKRDFYVPPGIAESCEANIAKKKGGHNIVMTTAKRFVDPEAATKNADYHIGCGSPPPAKHVPATASLKSCTPRFEKTREPPSQGDFYVPKSFIEEILSK